MKNPQRQKAISLWAIMVSILFITGCQVEKKSLIIETPPEIKQEVIVTENAVSYEIVEAKDLSIKAIGDKLLSQYEASEIEQLPTNKKMSYKIVVSPTIKKALIEPTVNKIIEDLMLQDGDVDEMALFLYSGKDVLDNSCDVASVIWAPKGELGNVTPEIAKKNDRSLYKTSITANADLEEYLRHKGQLPIIKFGLTEQQRKQFFKEYADAENKARAGADKKYPIDPLSREYILNATALINKNIDEERTLTEKYKAELFKKYGITKEQGEDLKLEGLEKNWSM